MTTTQKTLNETRPADPSKISFARDCFVQDGEEVYWTTSNPTGWGYPVRHATREAAENYARRRRHEVQEVRTPRMRRVRWF